MNTTTTKIINPVVNHMKQAPFKSIQEDVIEKIMRRKRSKKVSDDPSYRYSKQKYTSH